MIHLKPMSFETFEKFKVESQSAYASHLASVEIIPLAEALKHASEQFEKLVPSGRVTINQLFFDVHENSSKKKIGYLWIGFQDRFGRKVASINDIAIEPVYRGKGFGKALMKLVEKEARRAGATRIRLHVFHNNEVAKQLYYSMGFSPTNLDMRKDL
ncbi:MAG: GNAT family N-acetyltransferase [Bdellovibrionaceae bacterium]|nr:GNAT family N-acetyltransferase [Pseudobdellovibrionaceae bacterium]